MPEYNTIEAITPNGPRFATAGEDLTADKGKFVKFSSGNLIKVTATTDDCVGVIKTGGASGAQVTYMPLEGASGSVYVYASAAISAGAPIKFTATGQAAAATFGTDKRIGRAVTAASGAGALFEAYLFPSSVYVSAGRTPPPSTHRT